MSDSVECKPSSAARCTFPSFVAVRNDAFAIKMCFIQAYLSSPSSVAPVTNWPPSARENAGLHVGLIKTLFLHHCLTSRTGNLPLVHPCAYCKFFNQITSITLNITSHKPTTKPSPSTRGNTTFKLFCTSYSEASNNE